MKMRYLDLFRTYVQSAEELAKIGDVNGSLESLRQIPLYDFGAILFNLPSSDQPFLSAVLPSMAKPDVQQAWTGAVGLANLRGSLSFISALTYGYQAVTSKPLNGASVLDFGCGYGRMMRLLYYFSNPDRLAGCDPWPRAIEICEEDRILGHLAVSDYLPKNLPFEEDSFDFIFANSVFTHTSKLATTLSMLALRSVVKPKGLLAITIRPVEFWEDNYKNRPDISTEQFIADHKRAGFAFRPHNRAPIDGDVTYGDTSISLDWLSQQFPQWNLVRLDRTIESPLQIIVFLRPR